MHWHSTTFRKFLILITFTSFFCVAAFAQQTATPTITALFKFTCNRKLCSNGIFPKGKLVQARDGKFYGATSSGGTAPGSGGTIFQITPTGMLTTLFSFRFRWQWTISQRLSRNSIRKSGARAG